MEISDGFKKMVDKNLKENAVLISFFKRPTRFEHINQAKSIIECKFGKISAKIYKKRWE